MQVIGRLSELNHQASISASSTGRYQIDERDANEGCLDSIMIDERNSIAHHKLVCIFPHHFAVFQVKLLQLQ